MHVLLFVCVCVCACVRVRNSVFVCVCMFASICLFVCVACGSIKCKSELLQACIVPNLWVCNDASFSVRLLQWNTHACSLFRIVCSKT